MNSSANTALSSPTGLAFDSAGNLFVANHGNNTIEMFTSAGVGSLFANSGLSGPQYIAFQVPEPSSFALLALGLPTLLARRRSPPAVSSNDRLL